MDFLECADLENKPIVINFEQVVSFRPEKHVGGAKVTIVTTTGTAGAPNGEIWLTKPSFQAILTFCLRAIL